MPPAKGQSLPPAVRDTADRLHSGAIRLLRRLRVEDRVTGLSGPRASALSVIVFRGPLPLGELARAEQVRPPTVTRLVAGLERAGLVRRRRDERDGRIQLVEATAAGKRVLDRGRRRRVERLARSLLALGAEDRAVLTRAAGLLGSL